MTTHIYHGHSRTPEYRSFCLAKSRCNNSNLPVWKFYGGRGIKFLFENFPQFYAELGPKPSLKHSLDRINTNGNYEPGNCRWSTPKEQANNCRPRSPRTEEHKRNLGLARRGIKLSPEHKAKWHASLQTPEARRKRSESITQWWAMRKARVVEQG